MTQDEVNVMLRQKIVALEEEMRGFVIRLNEAELHRSLTPLERKIKGHCIQAITRGV